MVTCSFLFVYAFVLFWRLAARAGLRGRWVFLTFAADARGLLFALGAKAWVRMLSQQGDMACAWGWVGGFLRAGWVGGWGGI